MKTLIRSSLIALALIALVGTPALAQEAGDSEPPDDQSYDFSGDTIDGDMMRPDGDIISPTDFAEHTSLIRVRTEFTAEIIQSAEDL